MSEFKGSITYTSNNNWGWHAGPSNREVVAWTRHARDYLRGLFPEAKVVVRDSENEPTSIRVSGEDAPAWLEQHLVGLLNTEWERFMCTQD